MPEVSNMRAQLLIILKVDSRNLFVVAKKSTRVPVGRVLFEFQTTNAQSSVQSQREATISFQPIFRP